MATLSALAPPRLPVRRLVALAAALAAVLPLAYVVARETSMFAVRTIEIHGASPRAARDVRAQLEPLVGTSLVAVDGDELERRLRGLPAVHSARVDRAFPHALAVVVREERPLAVLRDARHAWLVSGRARVIRAIRPGARARIPRIWMAGVAGLQPGQALTERRVRLALRAIAVLPKPFPARVFAVGARKDGLVVVLAARTEVRLGPATDLRTKLEAARAVLASLSRAERLALAYIDVSLPNRPVAAERNTQPVRDS